MSIREDINNNPNQTGNPDPDPAENADHTGWLNTLNTFLERAFTEADRATGC